MRLILASQSPRRQELLSLISENFEVRSVCMNEIIRPHESPDVAVMALAFQKANQVAEDASVGDLVIGSDTVVYLNEFLGKPKDQEDAKRMLRLLSGQWHDVFTGYCIIEAKTNRIVIDYVKTSVKMKELSDEEIEAYISSKEPMDKAGAYGIQGKGALFVEGIVGDYYTVMGLPVYKLHETLVRHFGYHNI